MGKLDGKVAVVTGASKGIGAAIAEHLAEEGAAVVVNYASSKAGGDAVVKRITDKGGKAIAVGANLAKPEDVTTLIDETVKAYGRIDVLVNNAGVYDFAPLEAITPEFYHRIFDLNVLGLLLTTQAAVKHFPAEGGSVINISSIVGRAPMANSVIYGATKSAVDGISLGLARELGPKKIRVNSISPGLVTTEGTANFIDEFSKVVVPTTPLGRVGLPDDIAKVVTFFASEDSFWITGETIGVGGGART